jgi:hypothetical protein
MMQLSPVMLFGFFALMRGIRQKQFVDIPAVVLTLGYGVVFSLWHTPAFVDQVKFLGFLEKAVLILLLGYTLFLFVFYLRRGEMRREIPVISGVILVLRVLRSCLYGVLTERLLQMGSSGVAAIGKYAAYFDLLHWLMFACLAGSMIGLFLRLKDPKQ